MTDDSKKTILGWQQQPPALPPPPAHPQPQGYVLENNLAYEHTQAYTPDQLPPGYPPAVPPQYQQPPYQQPAPYPQYAHPQPYAYQQPQAYQPRPVQPQAYQAYQQQAYPPASAYTYQPAAAAIVHQMHQQESSSAGPPQRPIPGANATQGVSDRVRFIRLTYLHLLGAILAFAGLLWLLMNNTFLATKVSVPLVTFALGGRWNWGVVLAVFMVVSWVADYWASHATSRPMQYAGLA